MKTIELPKSDVKKLTHEELKELAALKDHAALPLLSVISEDFVRNILETVLQTIDEKEKLKLLDAAYYMRNSLSFLLDAPTRASEELKTRVDTDTDKP